MASIQKGTTFTDGVSANAAALNNLVDAATILPGIITDRTTATPATADQFLIYDASASALAQCTLQNIIDAFPTDATALSKSLRTLGTGATQAVAGNDARLSATLSAGVGKLRVVGTGGFGSLDTAAAPKDLIFTPVNINTLTNIDWDTADVFYDAALSANKTYTFSNVRDGRVIVLQINQNGHTVAFPVGWLVLGTANTASWNAYSLVKSVGASLAVCAS